MRFKAGDKVEVVGEVYHIPKGTITEVKETLNNNVVSIWTEDKTDYWYVYVKDVEKIPKEKNYKDKYNKLKKEYRVLKGRYKTLKSFFTELTGLKFVKEN